MTARAAEMLLDKLISSALHNQRLPTAPLPLPLARPVGMPKGVLILFVVIWHVITKSHLQVDWQIGLPAPGAWVLFGERSVSSRGSRLSSL